MTERRGYEAVNEAFRRAGKDPAYQMLRDLLHNRAAHSVGPDGLTPALSAAVEALRAAGWTVVAPADPNAVIPAPQAGQVWVPMRPGSRAKPRTIVWAGCRPPMLRWVDYDTVGFVCDPSKPGFPETGHDSWVSMRGFRAWVTAHTARLQETAP